MKKQAGTALRLLALLLILSLLSACGARTASAPPETGVTQALAPGFVDNPAPAPPAASPADAAGALDEDGSYTSKEDVALYLRTYGRLPGNFMTKAEARALGWEGGSLEDFAPGGCIGGDPFGNREGLLPAKAGRTYAECDIDTRGASSRGAKRLVFSNDGLIYYTEDHYASFTLLYGEEEP